MITPIKLSTKYIQPKESLYLTQIIYTKLVTLIPSNPQTNSSVTIPSLSSWNQSLLIYHSSSKIEEIKKCAGLFENL